MVSLQSKAIKSVKWTSIKTIIVGLTGPAILIMQARFFSPNELAYIAIIMIFIELFKLIENFGISQAIIQRDSITKKEASSLFIFNISLSFIVGVVLFYLSPLISGLYNLADLEYFLKVASLIIIVGGPALLFRAFLEKNLYFKELSIIEILRNLTLFCAITIFLFAEFGVLGIVYAHLFTTIMTTLLIIFLCLKKKLVKISFYFNFKTLNSFMRFGLFFSGKQIVTFIVKRLDELIIGLYLGTEIMGIYYFGKSMLEKLRMVISSAFSKVLFSVFAKLKSDREKTALVYRTVTQYLSFMLFPVFIGIAVTAHLFVPVIFGDEWIDSVIVFQVFSLVLMLVVVTSNVSSSYLYSINKPEILFYIDFFSGIIYISVLFLFASEGLTFILVVYSIYTIIRMLLLQVIANKNLSHKISQFISLVIPILLLSGTMGFIIILFQSISKNYLNNFIQLFGSVIIGIACYICLAYLFQRKLVKGLLRRVLKNA